MEESELKTSAKQRVAIIVIALLMLVSVIAGYVAIVVGGSSKTEQISQEKIQQYEYEYDEKLAEFKKVTADDFAKFAAQVGRITSYDENAANDGGVVSHDLVTGDGRVLEEGDTNYLTYYAGWCADGKVFDSSLDSTENPTAFTRALDASRGLIVGWNEGVVGMKLGGVREITIPGEKAYGTSREICGGYNKPLKFLVMAVENADPLRTAASELDIATSKVQYAMMGIDYEKL